MKKKTYFTLMTIVLALNFSCKQEKAHRIAETDAHTKINFMGQPLDSLKTLAKKENKLIFIDCYTSWCAPCKWMDKNVFVEEQVYKFYNKTFINTKIDMEKGEGPQVKKEYGVSSFPTYLFIDGNGQLIHTSKGRMSAEEFLDEGKNSLDPSKALVSLAKKYENNNISNEELTNYVLVLYQTRNKSRTSVLQDLLSRVDDAWFISPSGWKLIEHFTKNDTSRFFRTLNSNKNYFTSLVGEDAVNTIYARAIMPNIEKSLKQNNNALFAKLLDSLKKLPYSKRDLSMVHSKHFLNQNDVKGFVETSNHYANNVLQDNPEAIAALARYARTGQSKDKGFLEQAGHLITQAYKMAPNNYAILYNYSEILSDLGHKEEALRAAKLVVKMADTISSKAKNSALINLSEIEKHFQKLDSI